ncbi:MAG TPA: hypothetical protein PLD59_01225 [Tepidisphaeraceae bacterium]|nr:hypothetical protein [Tepidisphaeraceae bacterium]
MMTRIGLTGQTRNSQRVLLAALGAIGLTALSTPTIGADRSWSNTAGGNFSTSTNWQNGLLPGVNDVANFSNSSVFFPPGLATYTITFNANAQTQAVKVKNDFVTFNLGGRTYTATSITGNEVGSIGGGGTILVARNARLTIQNGTFNFSSALTPQMLVGAVPGGVGSLTVTGGATVTGLPRLLIGGASATGTLTMDLGGGTILASTLEVGSGTGSIGNAVIGGPFSQLTTNSLLVGNDGNGTMLINIGAVVQNNGTAILGDAIGTAGVVSMDTSTARWNQTGTLVIGNSGSGTVSTSARLQGGVAILAHNPGGSAGVLSVIGSSGSASFTDLTIGRFGSASLVISSGGRVASTGARTIVAEANVSHASVDVFGSGSQWSNAGTLEIGVNGNGTLNIGNGGSVNSVRGHLGSAGTGTVDVTGANSRWSCTGTLQLGGSGNGRLRIMDGGLVTTSRIDVRGPTSSILVSGLGSRLDVAPFLSQGSIAVSGGSLTIENGGRVETDSAAIPSSTLGGRGEATVGGADSLWDISDSMTVGVHATQPTGAIGTLTINAGGVVDVFNDLRVGNQGTIVLNGGTLRLNQLFFDPTAEFNFNSGTMDFEAFPNLTMSAAFLDKLLGPAHTIGAGQHLISQGFTIASAPLVLDGGNLTVAAFSATPPIQFDSGTFGLTFAPLIIGSTGPLGSVLSLDVRNVNVTNSTTIELGGELHLRGGSFVSGGGITNGGLIAVDAPLSFTLQNPITNNGELRVAAGATASFVNSITGTGSITGGGAKIFLTGGISSIGSIDGTGSTSVQAAASLTAGRIREHSLSVGGIARIAPGGASDNSSRLNTLAVVGGFLDLADSALVIDYTGASPLTQIGGFLQNGFAGGSWNGAGINSSIAATTPNRALGFAEATDIGSPSAFAGQPIDSTAVLIRFTLPGDADLSGAVDLNDFTRLAATFGGAGSWVHGNFNYDSLVNLDDFTALAANFGQSLPAGTPRVSVPEPGGVAGVMAFMLLGSRRTRRCLLLHN